MAQWSHVETEIQGSGVDGKALALIRNYLADRQISVVLAGQASEAIPINASVPQGSVLGPLLFSIYIDDLVDVCENELYLYDDDLSHLTLFARLPSKRDPKLV